MRETGIWDYSERLGSLIELLPRHQRNKRHDAYLLRLIETFQNYMTTDGHLTDDDIAQIGEHILFIHRLGTSFTFLLGDENWQMLLPDSALFKELPELFSQWEAPFRSTEFNIFTARLLQERGSIPVRFLREGRGIYERTPDLQLDDLAYFEAKDLQSSNIENLPDNIATSILSANSQLAQQVERRSLKFTAVCLDLPRTVTEWGGAVAQTVMLALVNAAASALSVNLIILSRSAVRIVGEELQFPHEWIVFEARNGTPAAALAFAQRLVKRVYPLRTEVQGEERPLERPL